MIWCNISTAPLNIGNGNSQLNSLPTPTRREYILENNIKAKTTNYKKKVGLRDIKRIFSNQKNARGMRRCTRIHPAKKSPGENRKSYICNFYIDVSFFMIN